MKLIHLFGDRPVPNIHAAPIGLPVSTAAMPPSVRLKSLVSPGTYAYCPKAILLYDWILCLDREMTSIWKSAGGFNAGVLVYMLSRYASISSTVFSTTSILPLSLLVRSMTPHFRTITHLHTGVSQPVIPYLACSKDTRHIIHAT